MVAVLRGLADGAIRPAELKQGLPDAGHSVVMRRLRSPASRASSSPTSTARTTAARSQRPHPTPGSLQPHQRWSGAAQGERPGPPLGADLVRASRATRPGRRPRDQAPRRPAHAQNRTPAGRRAAVRDRAGRARGGLGRSALRRRLRDLVLAGLLKQRNRDGPLCVRADRWCPAPRVVAMLAGRWEWQWSRPAHPAPGSDLTTCCTSSRPSPASPSRWLASASCTWTRAERTTPTSTSRRGPATSLPSRRPAGATGGGRPRHP